MDMCAGFGAFPACSMSLLGTSMKRPLNVCFLQFLSAAIPLVLIQAYRVDARPMEVLSRPVPAERIHWMPAQVSSQPAAMLHVVRQSHWKGWAQPITLLIDGKPAASIKDGENVMLHIPPGQYVIGLKYSGQDPLNPKSAAEPRSTVYSGTVQQLSGGKSHDFRIVSDARWNWQLDQK